MGGAKVIHTARFNFFREAQIWYGLARMNMILHNNPTALVMQGNTLSDPKFKDGDTLNSARVPGSPL